MFGEVVPIRSRSSLLVALMHLNQFHSFLSRARCSSSLVRVTQQHLISYPKYNFAGDQHIPAAAIVWRVTDARGSEPTEHTVVLCLYRANDGEAIEFWCADRFLDGHLDRPDAKRRVSRVAELLDGSDNDPYQQAMMRTHAMFSGSGACSFWRGWRRSQTCCGHVARALVSLRLRRDIVKELRGHLSRTAPSLQAGYP